MVARRPQIRAVGWLAAGLSGLPRPSTRSRSRAVVLVKAAKHRNRNPSLCQRSTVSGFTSSSASRHLVISTFESNWLLHARLQNLWVRPQMIWRSGMSGQSLSLNSRLPWGVPWVLPSAMRLTGARRVALGLLFSSYVSGCGRVSRDLRVPARLVPRAPQAALKAALLVRLAKLGTQVPAQGRVGETLEASERTAAVALPERLQAEHLQAEHLQAEHLQAEHLQAEHLQAERLQAERLQAERLQAERLQAERLQAEHLQAEHLQAEHLQAEHLQAEHLQAEHLQAGHLQPERMAFPLAATERLTLAKAATTATRQQVTAATPDVLWRRASRVAALHRLAIGVATDSRRRAGPRATRTAAHRMRFRRRRFLGVTTESPTRSKRIPRR